MLSTVNGSKPRHQLSWVGGTGWEHWMPCEEVQGVVWGSGTVIFLLLVCAALMGRDLEHGGCCDKATRMQWGCRG